VKYIWLFFMLLIILRSIRLLVKRSESWGKPDAPRDESPFYQEDPYLESSPVGGPGEDEPELNLPEYPNGLGDDLTTVSAVSGYEGRPDELARECRSDQELHGRYVGPELFDGKIYPGEFIKGMVWSQILDSRGGIQAKNRFKYSYYSKNN